MVKTKSTEQYVGDAVGNIVGGFASGGPAGAAMGLVSTGVGIITDIMEADKMRAYGRVDKASGVAGTFNDYLTQTNKPASGGYPTLAMGGNLPPINVINDGNSGKTDQVPVDKAGTPVAKSKRPIVALTDNGEVIVNGYVFSADLGFAKEAQRILKRFGYNKETGELLRPNDPKMRDAFMQQIGKLQSEQEQLKQSVQPQGTDEVTGEPIMGIAPEGADLLAEVANRRGIPAKRLGGMLIEGAKEKKVTKEKKNIQTLKTGGYLEDPPKTDILGQIINERLQETGGDTLKTFNEFQDDTNRGVITPDYLDIIQQRLYPTNKTTSGLLPGFQTLPGSPNGTPDVQTLPWSGPDFGFDSYIGSDSNPEDAWIRKIMEYEASKGSATGTGLPNWGYNSRSPKTIDDAINYFREDYLPKVQNYPASVQPGAADFLYNTGKDPRIYILDQYYRNKLGQELPNRAAYAGAMSNGIWTDVAQQNEFEKAWNQYGDDIMKSPDLGKWIDAGRDYYYQNINMVDGKPNPAYSATWQGRIANTPATTTSTTKSFIPQLTRLPSIPTTGVTPKTTISDSESMEGDWIKPYHNRLPENYVQAGQAPNLTPEERAKAILTIDGLMPADKSRSVGSIPMQPGYINPSFEPVPFPTITQAEWNKMSPADKARYREWYTSRGKSIYIKGDKGDPGNPAQTGYKIPVEDESTIDKTKKTETTTNEDWDNGMGWRNAAGLVAPVTNILRGVFEPIEKLNLHAQLVGDIEAPKYDPTQELSNVRTQGAAVRQAVGRQSAAAAIASQTATQEAISNIYGRKANQDAQWEFQADMVNADIDRFNAQNIMQIEAAKEENRIQAKAAKSNMISEGLAQFGEWLQGVNDQSITKRAMDIMTMDNQTMLDKMQQRIDSYYSPFTADNSNPSAARDIGIDTIGDLNKPPMLNEPGTDNGIVESVTPEDGIELTDVTDTDLTSETPNPEQTPYGKTRADIIKDTAAPAAQAAIGASTTSGTKPGILGDNSDIKAKREAIAKSQAEEKARVEAEAAAAEKAKLEAEAKAKAEAEAKAKAEADAKAKAEAEAAKKTAKGKGGRRTTKGVVTESAVETPPAETPAAAAETSVPAANEPATSATGGRKAGSWADKAFGKRSTYWVKDKATGEMVEKQMPGVGKVVKSAGKGVWQGLKNMGHGAITSESTGMPIDMISPLIQGSAQGIKWLFSGEEGKQEIEDLWNYGGKMDEMYYGYGGFENAKSSKRWYESMLDEFDKIDRGESSYKNYEEFIDAKYKQFKEMEERTGGKRPGAYRFKLEES